MLNPNKISLNVAKTEVILFKSKKNKNNCTLTPNSNYAENGCTLLTKLGTWVFWLIINLTGILILIILFQNLREVIQFYPY